MEINLKGDFKNIVLKRATDYVQRVALVHRTHLREEVPKETKTLMQSFKLQQPTKRGNSIVVEVVSNIDYKDKQDKGVVRHLTNYKEEQPNKKMAAIGRRNKKQPNRVYITSHSANYSRGIYHADKQGLLSKFATDFKEKAMKRTLKVAKRLAAEIFKI